MTHGNAPAASPRPAPVVTAHAGAAVTTAPPSAPALRRLGGGDGSHGERAGEGAGA
ncbi:hypothetical protein GCM10019016_120410 [Streptomyces prasinosporus]|uniref:Uncharacterized protein n=1 Tax=Streptomyces prasinosporus TaxID=68256 RepID=A0ABP6UE06_9ACTN